MALIDDNLYTYIHSFLSYYKFLYLAAILYPVYLNTFFFAGFVQLEVHSVWYPARNTKGAEPGLQDIRGNTTPHNTTKFCTGKKLPFLS